MNTGENKTSNALLDGARLLITGGTGSLGKVLTRRLLTGQYGRPEKIVIFSRDEAKQYDMRLQFNHLAAATEEIIYRDSENILQFKIGDVRNYASIASALRGMDYVFNAAALKQVPTCEYSPYEATLTNIDGAENIVRAIEQLDLDVDTVVGISTDKACKPVNVMGMSKAIQERVFISGNLRCGNTRLLCVRYGNVLASRGSVIPLFHSQIRQGGPITITSPDMTRFLLPLEGAVDVIMAAVANGYPGETFIPIIPSARIIDLIESLTENTAIETRITGIRPGEKLHEILISEEEATRTSQRNGYYVITPALPELARTNSDEAYRGGEYCSEDDNIPVAKITELLAKHGLRLQDRPNFQEFFG